MSKKKKEFGLGKIFLYSSIFAAVILGISLLFPYDCGLWDGIDLQGNPIGGMVTCKGFPLEVVNSVEHFGMGNLLNTIVNYLLYFAAGSILTLLAIKSFKMLKK